MPAIRVQYVETTPTTVAPATAPAPVPGAGTGAQQAAGAGAGVLLLAALAVGPGLGWAGWLAGTGFLAALWVLLAGAAERAGVGALGPADLVTLGRAVLVAVVAALVADGLVGGTAPAVLLGGLAAVALALDAVDGRVARRTGTVSALGARFDMEVDAVLLLVLSVHLAPRLGPWVLAVGGLRYAFVAAGWALPWLRGTLPPRRSAKVVAATAGVALVVATVLPTAAATGAVATVLALLGWSFGRDVWWLRRRAR